MPVVQVRGYGPIQFPDNMSAEEIKRRVEYAEAQIPKVEFDPRELSLGTQLKGGFKRAASGIGSLVTDVVPAIGGSLLGFEDYAREQMAEAAEKRRAAEFESPTAYKKLSDIRGVGDVPGFLAETLGEGAVDIASLLVPGGAGSVVGRRLAQRGAAEAGEQIASRIARRGVPEGPIAPDVLKGLQETATRRAAESLGQKGADLGFKTGLRGGAYGLASGEIFQSVEEETGKLEPILALALGVPFAALDSLLPETIAKQLGATGKAVLTKEMLERSTLPEAKGLAARLSTAIPALVAKEGLTEAAQENISILAEQIAGSRKDFFDPENVDRMLMAGVKGGIAGGVFGAPGAAVEAARNKSADQALIDAETARRAEITKGEEEKRAALEEAKTRFETAGLGETAPLFQEGELPLQETKIKDFLASLGQEPSKKETSEVKPITQQYLADSGIVSGPINKAFKGKDLNDPEVVSAFREILSQRAEDPKLSVSAQMMARARLDELPLVDQESLLLPEKVESPERVEKVEPPERAERVGQAEQAPIETAALTPELRAFFIKERLSRGLPITPADRLFLRDYEAKRKEAEGEQAAKFELPEGRTEKIARPIQEPTGQLTLPGFAPRQLEPTTAEKAEPEGKAAPKGKDKQQMEMFTPSGKPTKGAKDVAKTVEPTSGTGVSVPSRPDGGVPTEGTPTPKPSGVAGAEPSTESTVRREEVPPSAVELDFQEYVEEGLNTEYPSIGKALFKYTQDGDAKGVVEATKDPQYPEYKDSLRRLLETMFPNGQIPVRFLPEYAGFSDKGSGPLSVSINPDWGKGAQAKGKPVESFDISINDVIAAGNGAEGELIINRSARPKPGARIERKESFRGRTTPDVTYIVYDQDGNRSQTFNKKADAQQHLDLLTLSREDFLNKYPDIRTKVEAIEAEQKKLAEKTKPKKETPSVTEAPKTQQAKEERKAAPVEGTKVAEPADETELTDQEQRDLQAELEQEQATKDEVKKVKKAKKERRQKEAESAEKGEPPPKKQRKARVSKRAGSEEFQKLEGGAATRLYQTTQFTNFLERGYIGFAPLDLAQQIDNQIEAVKGSADSKELPNLEIQKADIAEDMQKVKDLITTPKADTPEARAAQVYFSKMPRLVDGLINIAFGTQFEAPHLLDTPQADQYGTTVEENFFSGLSQENARKAFVWVEKNLSPVSFNELAARQTAFAIAAKTTDEQIVRLVQFGFRGPAAPVELDIEGKPIKRQEGIQEYEAAFKREYSAVGRLGLALDKAGMPKEQRQEIMRLATRKVVEVLPPFTTTWELNTLNGDDLIRVLPERNQRLVSEQVDKAGPQARTALAKHYGVASDSPELLSRILLDVVRFTNKGIEAVDRAIRSFIKQIANGLMSVALIFNPAQLIDTFSYNPVKTYTDTIEIKAVVPTEARANMSAEAVKVYESMAPAAKESGKGFMIADKPAGRLHVFDADGNLIAQDTALYGRDYGDVLQGEKRVTPAGKYTLKVASSPYAGGKAFELVESEHRIGNTDYVIAVHAAWLGDKTEKRDERLATAAISDKRISYGCINTKHETFLNKLMPNADKLNGGMVFVIPDEVALSDTLFKPTTQTVSKQKFVRGATVGDPLHPAIVACLKNDDLPTALKSMASMSGMVGKVAGALLRANIDTSVKVVDNLTDEAGKPVAGFFDPQTNTIFLDSKAGLNSHVTLHEALHAATSHVLDNPSHPVTKQLQALYNKVKGSLDTAYGATSLDEFVAEAFSNPEFQAKLQSIFPDGKPISAWARFTRLIANALRSFMRVPIVPNESAFDQVDRLVNQILSPAPDQRNAGVLYAVSANPKWFNSTVDTVLKAANAAGVQQNNISKIDEFLRNTATGAMRKFTMQFLPLHAIADLAKKYIPQAVEINRTINLRAGEEDKTYQEIEPVVTRVEKWAKSAGKAKLDTFNDLVYGSTLAKIDVAPRYDDKLKKQITPTEADYAGTESKTEFRRLKSLYDSLGPEGQKAYRDARDTYRKLYTYILDSLTGRIDDVVTDKAQADRVKKSILEKLAKKGGIDPYFPLTREGKYWVSYRTMDASGQEDFVVEAFKEERTRKLRIEELEKANKILKDAKGELDVNTFSQLSDMNYRRVPSTSFVYSILNNVPDESKDDVLRLFVDAMPETAFAKSFQTRKETSGFNRDAVKTLREKAFPIARQVANMKYAAKLDKLVADAREGITKKQETKKGDVQLETAYFDTLEQHVQFAIKPNTNRAAQILSTLGFNMTLGFNVSSALVNLGQVPFIVAPYLSGEYQNIGGLPTVMKEVNKAYKVFIGSGFKRDVPTIVGDVEVNRRSMPSLDNINYDAPGLSEDIKRLKILAQKAQEQGMLNRSQMYETLEAMDDASVVSKANKLSGIMMHMGERMNRQVTMVAAYNLELAKMKKQGRTIDDAAMAEAADRALYLTELTNGGITAAAAPLIAQKSSIGKLAFMFKRYGVSMYYLLFKAARTALTDQDKATRTAAWKQVGYIAGMTALTAGVSGLPMFGAIAMLYNMFKDDDEEDLESIVRKGIGELPFKGLLNYTTGLEIASRMGLNDLIMRDVINENEKTLPVRLLEAFGGPVYGTFTKWERAASLMKEGHYDRALESALPSALGNAFKSMRYYNEGANTLRGDPITGDISTWNSAAQLFGFAPAEYVRQLEINALVKGIDKAIVEEKTKQLKRYYVASRMGDTEGVQDAKEALGELRQKYPKLFPEGIEQSIQRSMAQHKRTTKEMYHGITLSKAMRDDLINLASEYED